MNKRWKKWVAGAMAAISIFLQISPMTSMDAFAADTGVVNVSALNFRSGASMGSRVTAVLGKGTTVTILGQNGSWYKVSVSINGQQKTGYISSQYVSKTNSGSGSGSNSGTTVSGSTGMVNVSGLRLRSGASTSTSTITYLSSGTSLKILEKLESWYKVSVGSHTGYVYAEYVTVTSNGSSSSGNNNSSNNNNSTSTPSTSGNKTGVVNTNGLNIRSKASTSSSILACVSKNTSVTITGTSGSWYAVTLTYNGKTITGYAYAQYVNVTGNAATSTPSNQPSNSGSNTTTPSTRTGKVNTSVLNVRTGAGIGYARVGYVYLNNIVTIYSESNGWYQILTQSNGKTINGYVSKTYVDIQSTFDNTQPGNNNNSGNNNNNSSSDNFETQMQAFPESYRTALRNLHAQHSNWVFKPIQTGLDWNTVVKEESVFRRNTVSTYINANTNYADLSTAAGAYDWGADKFTLCDGRTWYSASEDLIKYYLDPRNFMDEKYIFTFESLAYDSAQKQSVVESILSGSFMRGNYTEKDPSTGITSTRSYAGTYMEAAKISGVSPYYLASRTLGEVGPNGTGQTSGTYGSYAGYYNFYSIGAYDGKDAVANGLKFAQKTDSNYYLPWNTRYKAIVGGAKYTAANYISVGQNTPYFQKFNVVNKNGLYMHQYMTAVNGGAYSADLVYNSYKKYNVLNDTIVFYIPVYNNMPAAPCAKPAKKGNPNSYLKKLTLNNGNINLSETFAYNKTEYSAVVTKNVSSISVSAQTVSAYASIIRGTGTYALTPGKTTKIEVVCRAGDGSLTTYTINVYRSK